MRTNTDCGIGSTERDLAQNRRCPSKLGNIQISESLNGITEVEAWEVEA
jgi:hypothetical protein